IAGGTGRCMTRWRAAGLRWRGCGDRWRVCRCRGRLMGGSCWGAMSVRGCARTRPAQRAGRSAPSTARGRARRRWSRAGADSFVAALEPGRSSWTAMLDAVRLRPSDDVTAVTAEQVREVVDRLRQAGHWREGDPDILIVFDAGYDVTRLAFLLADLPVQLLG